MSLNLSVSLQDGPAQIIPVRDGRLLIGTLLTNEIVLNAPGVDPIHAMIEDDEHGQKVLVDLGSAGGIKLNGQLVQVEAPIRIGDTIEIAGINITVMEQDIAVAAAEDTVNQPLPQDMHDDEVSQEDDEVTTTIRHDRSGEKEKKDVLFSPRKARPAGNVLEVVAYWGDTVLDVELFHPSYKGYEAATIGDPTRAHLLAGGKKNISRHLLAKLSGDGFKVQMLDDMKARVRKGGEVKQVKGPNKLSLGKRDLIQISHGAVRYFLMFVKPPDLILPKNQARDPIFAMLISVAMLLYFISVPFIWMSDPKEKDLDDDDVWALVNLPEKKEEPKPEPKKPEPKPPEPKQKVAEKKKPPPPKPPKPKPEPVKPAKPVEKPKPVQTKPVEVPKPDVKKEVAKTLENKPPAQPKEPKPSLSKLSEASKTEGMASTGAKKPDFKLAGPPTKNKSLITGGEKGSGMGQTGGARKGKKDHSVMGVEGVNNNKASGVNLSKLGLGAGKILSKTGPGAIHTNFRNSAGGAGGGSGSASKTYGLGGVGEGSSLGLAGTGSAVNNFGSGAGGPGGGQGGTGGLGGAGLGSGFGTRGTGPGGRGRANVVVPPGDPVVSGGLTTQEVQAVIRANLNQIRHCYEQLLQRSPNSAGKIKVQFVVAPDGRVSSAAIQSSTIADSVMKGCVTGKVTRWRFPQPRGGQSVTVNYPFVFNPL